MSTVWKFYLIYGLFKVELFEKKAIDHVHASAVRMFNEIFELLAPVKKENNNFVEICMFLDK